MADTPSPADPLHDEWQRLLPWYVTGRLDAADRAAVDRHLATCVSCRTELAREQALARAIAADSPATPTVDQGWEALRSRLTQPVTVDRPIKPPLIPARSSDRRGGWRAAGRTLLRPDRLRWVVAAQFAALFVLGTATLTSTRPAEYRALGDGTAARSGNVLVMFRPGTREADLRRLLNDSRARLVDGPTAANAYVLDVPGGATGPQLEALRRSPDVTMAEPIAQGPVE